MGRPPLSQETIREVSIRLIGAAQRLMLHSGVESVTIRMIAAEAGVNSAVLYKYFADLDELLLFACVDMLQSYCGELLRREKEMDKPSARERYMMTWELFCRYAFRQPDFMRHLFFSRHSGRLDKVVSAYYDLFPEQLAGMTEELRAMLRAGRLQQRNMEVLRPVLEGRVDEAHIHMVNDLTLGYFYALLSEREGGPEPAERTKRMLAACEFLIGA